MSGSELTVASDVRLHAAFESIALQRARDIRVYLPPGYADWPEARYPVLYLHDGQNLFDAATAFVPGQTWRIAETTDRLVRAGVVQPLIIVGIDHGRERRVDELAPTHDLRRRMGGSARLYGRFLIGELKPFIDTHYRTRPERTSTALGGSSMGGLVSLWLGIRHPEVFSRVAALSPSVWWDQRLIVREIEALAHVLPLTIWLDIGTAEGRSVVRDTRVMRDVLLAKGWQIGRDLFYMEARGATHSEGAWAERVAPMLTALFPAQAPWR